VASNGRTVWVADKGAGTVSRIDPRAGISQPILVAGGPVDIALGAGGAWVTLALGDAVARIDPSTGTVRSTTAVGRRPAGVAVGAGGVWVANSGDGTVSRLDPRTGDLADTIPVGASPQDVVVADGRVWVSVRPRRGIDRAEPGGTVSVETTTELESLDPALAYDGASWQILYSTCAKLLNYPDERGTAGVQLVPELAESLPRVSDGGRTYTFTIRRGFRFSPPSGEPVTAQSMKYSIERSMNPRMSGPARTLLSDLVGVNEPPHVRFAEIVKANLRRIGIDVQIKASGSTYIQVGRQGEPFDLVLNGWVADYPDPMTFLRLLDGRTIRPDNNLNLAYFDDPSFNRRLDAADALQSPARELALGRLDAQVARTAAPWAAVANERQHDFFSERIGCQLFNPVYGMDLAALCIRGEARE
jgi:YVTN family beta-propeller protein